MPQVDTEEAVKEFEEALSTFDISGMAEEMGVPKDMVEVGGVGTSWRLSLCFAPHTT